MAKRKDKIRISFIGNNADNVAGSMTLIETEEKYSTRMRNDSKVQTLFLTTKKTVNRSLFKPKNIDYVFLGVHIDHSGRIRNLSKKDLMARLSQPQLQATIKADATRLL